MVADSATLLPLPDVNIQSIALKDRTVSDDKGYFVIAGLDKDTVAFSLVGYYTKRIDINKFEEGAVVYLKQENRVLSPIVIEGIVNTPWLPQIPREKFGKILHNQNITARHQGFSTFKRLAQAQ